MKKSNIGFLYRWIGYFISKQNEAVNALQRCWKSLKSNLQKLFLEGGKIFG